MEKSDIVSQKKIEERELYDVFEEKWLTHWEDKPAGDSMDITVPRNKNGEYIGDIEMAKILCDEKGIAPELRTPDSSVCSIGYSAKDKKWYGWSHRSIYGFKVGDRGYEENGAGKEIIKTIEEARQSAVNYAECVS